jgi:Kef-type K+ transport system membrane component KefB
VNLVLLLVLGGLMHAARSFSAAAASTVGGTTLGLGYLTLTAFFAGKLFKTLRLPRLTGYLVAGVVVGPAALGLVAETMVANLQLVNGMAIALIALTAGGELEVRALKPLLRSILWIAGVTVALGTAALAAALFFARPFLPFMAGLGRGDALALAVVLGAMMAAGSPAVAVALRDELRAEGPVTRTVLGVVVLRDLAIILVFAATSTAAKAVLGVRQALLDTVAELAWQILGSVSLGIGIGVLLALYLRYVRGGRSLFVVVSAFLVAEVGQRVGLDPLLIALAAGLYVRNATDLGPVLRDQIQAASLPVYVVFFGVAGTTLHLDAAAALIGPVLLVCAVRAGALLAGARLAANVAGASEPVRRLAGYGLLPQAGLALALSILFARTFPEFGAAASALTLGVVAFNELIGPAIYKVALSRSGEAGRLDAAPRHGPAPEPNGVQADA